MSINFCLLMETREDKDIQLGSLCLLAFFFFLDCGVRVVAGLFHSFRRMSDCF